MDESIKNLLRKILDNLPEPGETKYQAMTYENGIEDLALFLLDEYDGEFEYAKK